MNAMISPELAAPPAISAGAKPKVLLLAGAKRNDNAQVRVLARSLGWEFREVTLGFNVLHKVPNVLLPRWLLNLTAEARATLASIEPPDLIMSCGKRSYRAAYALKLRGAGRARWIHLGRPWGPLAPIDLVLTTRQYGLPCQPNVVQLSAPIATVDIEPARATPNPLVSLLLTVLIGGNSSSYQWRARDFVTLYDRACALAKRLNARLLFVTSPRTPVKIKNLALAARNENIQVQCWDDAGADYCAVLSNADALVVSSDSASMLSEAMTTGKPVYVFRLKPRWYACVIRSVANELWPWLTRLPLIGCWLARLQELVVLNGLWVPARNLDALVDHLVDLGLRELDEDALAANKSRARLPLNPLSEARDAVLRMLSATSS
jgi:mitochondrial fission protein ELM1